jgi:hypothetical protein
MVLGGVQDLISMRSAFDLLRKCKCCISFEITVMKLVGVQLQQLSTFASHRGTIVHEESFGIKDKFFYVPVFHNG